MSVSADECPFGSLRLAIDPNPLRTDRVSVWEVHATTRTSVTCRTHSGVEATIERPDGTVVGTISGNPARQGTMSFQDLFRPNRSETVADVTWANPCSDVPVELVVRFEDGSYGKPARLTLPTQPCRDGPSHLGITLAGVAHGIGTATTAKP